jgi:enoyl-CoA hydratase
VSRATELLLTGANLPATEAASLGLISRVVEDAEGQAPGEGVVAEAMKVGEVIARKGRLSVLAVKEAVKICKSA